MATRKPPKKAPKPDPRQTEQPDQHLLDQLESDGFVAYEWRDGELVEVPTPLPARKLRPNG